MPQPPPPPTMGNLIFMQKIIVIPHIFFLKYYKDIADLLFSVLWAPKVKVHLALPTKSNNTNL